jgi:AcrR family transcriptional regulator
VAAEQTRAKLIETGLVLAEQLGLEGLSVNAVVAAAGVSKGTFFHHFSDRTSYLVALHRRFHDALADEIAAVIGPMTPGDCPRRPPPIWTVACATAASRRFCSKPAGTGPSPRRSCAAMRQASPSWQSTSMPSVGSTRVSRPGCG